MGASIRQSLVRYKRRCSKAVRKISAVGKNFLNVDRGNCHALVTWTFQGKSYESMALLDTGSQACIINIKVARELGISDDDIQKSNILLKAASGTGLQMYGTVDIDVTLAGTKIRHKIFVVKDRLLILGQDLLTKMKAVLYLSGGKVETGVSTDKIARLHQVAKNFTLPESYKLTLDEEFCKFDDSTTLTYKVETPEIAKLNYRQIAIYYCDDECEADIHSDKTSTCQCAGNTIYVNFVVNGRTKIKKSLLHTPISEYTRLKGFLINPPTDELDDEEEGLMAGEGVGEATAAVTHPTRGRAPAHRAGATRGPPPQAAPATAAARNPGKQYGDGKRKREK